MTREQAVKWIPILQAYAEGKTIEWNYGGVWKVKGMDYSFDCQPENYRIKPSPQFRPWTAEEAVKHIGAVVRYIRPESGNIGVVAMVLGVCPNKGIRTASDWFTFQTAFEQLECRSCSQAIFKPCGVQISGGVA